MPRRIALCLLIAWLAWISPVSAQGLGPQGPSGPGYYGTAPGGPHPGSSYPSEYTLQPTLEEQLVPQSRDIYGMDPYMDLGIAESLSRSWIRTDLLLMTLQNPSVPFLGATPAVTPPDTFDPEDLLPALDRISGARIFQAGRLATLDGIDNSNTPGLRVTMGIPTQMFTFEASGFVLTQSSTTLNIPTFIDVSNFGTTLGFTIIPVIPLDRNGAPSNLDYILFDTGMRVNSEHNLQGADARFVLGPLTPNVETEVSPIIGFNYVHLGNRLLISGEDTGSGTFHNIQSRANNHIFGPEVGLRMENRGKWITLGFEPKFTFGINRITNRLFTSQVFTATEADRNLEDSKTGFAPIIDLSTYARIRFSEHCNLNIGYQFMGMAGASHAEDNIIWNSSSDLTAPPLIALDRDTREFWSHGLNLGLEITF